MAYVVENGLPDLLAQLGTEIHDLDLTEIADGRVSRAWAARALETAGREVFRRLRKEHVDPLRFKQELSLTVDSSDNDLYPLNRRVRQVMRVFDYVSDGNEGDYYPLSTYDIDGVGWVLEPDGLRLRGDVTLSGTLKVWAVQTPARLHYGTAESAGAAQIVLDPTPDIGISSAEQNYYQGVRIGIESGTTGAGEVRRATSYTASSKTCVVPTWTTTPTGTIVYSTLLDLPDCMSRAVVLRAALIILRTDATMDRQLDDVSASYREAYESGKALLRAGKIGHLPQFRQVWDSGFGSFN